MIVRAERSTDVDAVREVVRAAFGEDSVPALLDELRASVAWLGLSYVAEESGEIVGHVEPDSSVGRRSPRGG